MSGSKLSVQRLLFAFLMPTFFGKVMIYYFGNMYSAFPDHGYGYGLVASILFTVGMILRFVWTYRNHSDQ